jgi:hypothetical protein
MFSIGSLVGQVLCIHRTVSLDSRDCEGGGVGGEGGGVFNEDLAKVLPGKELMLNTSVK